MGEHKNCNTAEASFIRFQVKLVKEKIRKDIRLSNNQFLVDCHLTISKMLWLGQVFNNKEMLFQSCKFALNLSHR
jgi:hypothetical protein